MRGLHAVGCIAGAAGAMACSGSDGSTAPTDAPVRFTVTNALIAPVTVAVDGVPVSILTTGRNSQITVTSRSHLLSWTSAKPADAEGNLIPDDMPEVRIATSGISGTLEITNVVNDQPYVTAEVFNAARAQVAIGVFDGTRVSCAGILPAATPTTFGFVQIGYYRLLAATEIRAYRNTAACTGPFVAWPRSQITNFAAKSGLLTLLLETPP